MRKHKSNPAQRNIDLSKTIAQDIEYYCKTSVLDEILCKKKGIDFNKELSQELDRKARFYFVVRKDYKYDVISGELFEPYLKENNIEPLPLSQKAIISRDHYIKSFM